MTSKTGFLGRIISLKFPQKIRSNFYVETKKRSQHSTRKIHQKSTKNPPRGKLFDMHVQNLIYTY